MLRAGSVAPLRARGLKPDAFAIGLRALVVAPLRARGLKQCGSLSNLQQAGRALTGAWIETRRRRM